MTELRNLQATGLTSIGQSLRTAFDLLNLNRLVTGIDNYGQVCSTEEADKNYEAPSQGVVYIHRPKLNSHYPYPSFASINYMHIVKTHVCSKNNRKKTQTKHKKLILSAVLCGEFAVKSL